MTDSLTEKLRDEYLELVRLKACGQLPPPTFDRERMAEDVRAMLWLPPEGEPMDDADDLARCVTELAALREVVDELGRSMKARASAEVVEAAAAIVENWMATKH